MLLLLRVLPTIVILCFKDKEKQHIEAYFFTGMLESCKSENRCVCLLWLYLELISNVSMKVCYCVTFLLPRNLVDR